MFSSNNHASWAKCLVLSIFATSFTANAFADTISQQAEDNVAKYYANNKAILEKTRAVVNNFLSNIAQEPEISYGRYYTQLSDSLLTILPYSINSGNYTIPNAKTVYNFALKCADLAALGYNRPSINQKGKWENICTSFLPIALAYLDVDRFQSDLTYVQFLHLEYKRIRFTLSPENYYDYNYIAKVVNPIVVANREEAKTINPQLDFNYSMRPECTSAAGQQSINTLNFLQTTLGMSTKITYYLDENNTNYINK
ncbi:hypothetical protein [Psittacicella gerlachiana]|uniref:Uncharacterized protein n=1 Tax=Psittacicella gerlachiana TaxID=2028574 RepID=A0A3A1Y943_9GAMM|nr:hypothetical protein [Psittacicella gerlachiana]RIY34823.1 hypothetical protein CKF59_04660 [Psittacicella gerlachiana]